MTEPAIPITGDDEADALLEDDPLALVVGMLLDQQVSMETAFLGPWKLKTRLGDSFNAAAIAAMGTPGELASASRAR